ncbi:arsenate reductase ArsC [bacterium]|nr:arsenate reductase ArsC [bacterium]MBU1884255.1 arsenate reductase ArsC [bacterium]
MKEFKVLFVCIHNSARSQMAEAFLKKYGSDKFYVESAGLEPGELNPLVVEVMKEEGIDISENKTKSAFDFVKQGKLFNYIVTVCDEANAQRCPIFPGVRERIMMSFEDPSSFGGTTEEKLEKIRAVKEKIKQEVLKLIELIESHKLKENFPLDWKLG